MMENMFDDGLYQMGNEKQHMPDHLEKSWEEAEKMNTSSPSRCCEVDAEPPKGDDEEETAQNPAAPAIHHICDFCGKKFSCRKGLGGHRRMHLQALRKEGHSKMVKIRLPNHSNPTHNKANCNDTLMMSDHEKHICYLCNKDFPSKKSLCGHMRSHPNRNCRGVLFPLTHPDRHNSCSSNFDPMDQNKEDDHDDYVGKVATPNEPAFDLSKYLPSWQKTDKRGRRCIGGAEAAQNLVYLSRGEYFCAECTELLPQVADLKESTSESGAKSARVPIPCEKRKIGDLPTSEKQEKMKVYKRGSLKLGNTTDEDDDFDSDKLNEGEGLSKSGDEKVPVYMDCEEEDEEEEEGTNWAKEECCVNNTKETSEGMYAEVTTGRLQYYGDHFDERKVVKNRKKLLMKLRIQDSEPEDKSFLTKTPKKPGDYKCGICPKSFPTFQALGGHRSIHKREKNISTRDESRPAEDNTCFSHLQQMNETKESDIMRGDKIESETFAPVLALGDDHIMMKCYSTGLGGTPLIEEASSADEASLSNNPIQEMGEASQSGPKILDFDLNEPPYVMQDDAKTKSICQA